jgi:L-lactate dehydrogenase complex protein LldG
MVGEPIVAAVGARTPEHAVSAREEVLDRIRTALAGSPEPPAVPRRYSTAGNRLPGSPELLELLAERLADYRASVLRCDEAELAGSVSAALAERDLRRVVAPAGVPSGWLDGAEVLQDDDPGGDPRGDPGTGRGPALLTVAQLDGADAVVTGCAVAIAETGTIVLDAGPDQGRRALTLIPDVHVVVVRAGQVVQTVPEGLARLDPRRPLTMISGPSATSDIELDRVEGVHGPRTLVVVLTTDSTAGRAG